MNTGDHKYCARYCEENIWHLAQEPAFAGADCVVAVIANREGACLFWDQRMCTGPDRPVWWDYHVILLVRRAGWLVYDLDNALPLPVDAATYLSRTFRMQDRMPAAIRPRFMLFDSANYVESFASDRSHMRDEAGRWLAPPPDWPPINSERGEGFPVFIERQLRAGAHIALEEMHARFGGDSCDEFKTQRP